MDEIADRVKKYDESYIREHLVSPSDVNAFAATFFMDVAELYDTFTRIRNIERNPTGFSYDEAPILGLLVRMWKLMKEIVRYYVDDNAEFVGILERPFIEAAVVSRFLLSNDRSVVEDYRKCSYKDRLRFLRDHAAGSAFFVQTKPGQRLVRSVQDKLRREGLTEADFTVQKRNRWKIQGKSFYDIFAVVERADMYAATYGMMSESIHGSWNDSIDFDLRQLEDGTFGTYPFSQPADIRYVAPLIRFSNPAYREWLQRIEAYDQGLADILDWIERVNHALFLRFDETFEEA
ncbi:MAG TPA: DUF5677 domain-containing protein [Gemmatimonadaceae bacterium]|nr:DUF5677 domain-containing protein [Gemmatimonadaceae bacterium]